MSDFELRILENPPLRIGLNDSEVDPLLVASGVTEGRLAEVLEDYIPKSDIDTTLSIEGDVAESKTVGDILMALFPTDSASGAIASFTDGADNVPVKSLSVGVEPVQSLNGQSAPYPPGGGANKFNKEELTNGIGVGVGVTQTTDGFVLKALASGTYKSMSYYTPFTGHDGATVYARGTVVNSGSNNGYISFRFYNDSAEISSSVRLELNSTRNAHHVTIPTGTTRMLTVAYVTGSATCAVNDTTTYSNVIVSLTDVAYSPYSNICPISGWDNVNVKRTGKNLLNPVIAQYNSQIVCFDAQNTTTYNTYLKEGTYTISYTKVGSVPSMYMRGETATSDTNLGTVTQKTFTITKAEKYKFWVYAGGGVNASDISNIQIEVGSTKTDYEPFTSSSYTIPLPSTVYGGTLNVTTGELVVDRFYFAPDNTVDASVSSQTDTVVVMDMVLLNNHLPNAVAGEIISNRFSTSIASGNAGRMVLGSQHLYVVIAKSEMESYDRAGFRAWVETHPSEFVYKLATPTTLALDPTEVRTLLGYNNIYADSGSVSVVYHADIGKYIDKRIGA